MLLISEVSSSAVYWHQQSSGATYQVVNNQQSHLCVGWTLSVEQSARRHYYRCCKVKTHPFQPIFTLLVNIVHFCLTVGLVVTLFSLFGLQRKSYYYYYYYIIIYILITERRNHCCNSHCKECCKYVWNT